MADERPTAEKTMAEVLAGMLRSGGTFFTNEDGLQLSVRDLAAAELDQLRSDLAACRAANERYAVALLDAGVEKRAALADAALLAAECEAGRLSLEVEAHECDRADHDCPACEALVLYRDARAATDASGALARHAPKGAANG